MPEATDNNSQPQVNPKQDNPASVEPAVADIAKPPEGLATNFWDTEKNEIKIPDLITDHSNLSKFKTETEARFKDRPESPDKYEIRVPESVKLPEGVEFKFDPDSPLMKMARQVAFDSGRGQAGFDEMIGMYIENQIAQSSEDETFAEETYQAELTKLGDNGKARIDAVDAYLKANLEGNEYEALKGITVNADAVSAIEKLMSKSRDATPKVPGEGGSEAALTEAELKSMQADPKYWRDQDPAFIQKVTEGFKKLYPGTVPTSH